jgi:hypothetical protein
MRRTIFLYDDGIVLCATLRGLDAVGVLGRSLQHRDSLLELSPGVAAGGFGYMRAGIRSLAGAGWIEAGPTLDPATTELAWTAAGRAAAAVHGHYLELAGFLADFSDPDPASWAGAWAPARAELFLELAERAVSGWALPEELDGDQREIVGAHLDGALAVPMLLALRGQGRLHEAGPVPPDDEIGEGMARVLDALGWIDPAGAWTGLGTQACDYAIHFGIVGSYLPMLARLPELYRGELSVASPNARPEWHVNRELNVIASGAAHGRYFADADELFVDLFNREPLADQPRFVADMGCGDGSWLIHLHDLISQHTVRGAHLDEHPLHLVGIDLSDAALEAARVHLAAAGVPALLVRGDVGDPDGLAATLAEHGLEMADGLHIRSFLDHDRGFLAGGSSIAVRGVSSAAYVDRAGNPLDAGKVERDLAAHMQRWAPHLERHGLIVLEAHCVSPEVARQHVGALHSIAFDAYHAYSHQYLVEYSSFLDCCRQAGLERVSRSERHYPSTRPFVAVSLNRFLAAPANPPLNGAAAGARPAGTWSPDPGLDVEDGRGLHGLLFENGDLRHPRLWCAAATGFVVGRALEAIERRLLESEPGEAIRLLDYGTGTGLAAIELLKACSESGLDARLAHRGVNLELHLVDLPGGWLAYGFELLGRSPRTRFHSLRNSDGAFRHLTDVTEGLKMDVVMANMVFHLIPPTVLEGVGQELATVMRPGAPLVWSSPDIGPADDWTVLFHDPNRALRARWLDLVDEADPAGAGPRLAEAIAGAARLDPAERGAARARADRRILPVANDASDVADALARHLDGTIELRSYEMLDEEIVDALLVPSNNSEYLPEVPDRELREEVARTLMRDHVLPAFAASGAGTALGVNVQWALGEYRKPVRR